MSTASSLASQMDIHWPRSSWTGAAFRRYHGGYAVVGKINLLGLLTIIVGLLLFGVGGGGVLLAIAGTAAQDTNAIIGAVLLFPLSVTLGVAGIALAVAGVAVRCLAQLTLAMLDAAINTSPFLDDEDRALAMRLGDRK